LPQKDTPFQWISIHDDELKDLKTALCSKPIIGHPDFTANSQPFIVYVDSSKTGVRAVLAQNQCIQHNGKE